MLKYITLINTENVALFYALLQGVFEKCRYLMDLQFQLLLN